MTIIFDKYRCPICKGNSFEIRRDVIDFVKDRGWDEEPGYVHNFYGKCLVCKYNLNLSMAFIEEFGARREGQKTIEGFYPCLAVERGYIEENEKGEKVTRYAYECGGHRK